ncbi:MAG TPA: hypothetical protein VKY65_16360 [Alphaproteobacteria bacterium]|nr:hypothetical protein [Alphaproteobacteria bacterium]
MTQSERIARELEGMMALVTTARQIIADGRAVDLGGLQERMARVCDDVLALPAEKAAGFRARLIALLDEVDRLTGDLEAQRVVLAHALGEVSTRRQALVAYAKGGTARK